MSFNSGLSFFGQAFSEPTLIETFAFRGPAPGVPFTLPAGFTATSLGFTSFFRYASTPPIDLMALAARSDFFFSAVFVSDKARASVSGPATGAFAAADVFEAGTWR